MALLNDILEWSETLPSWQRDASRRLLQNERGLTDRDYEELYTLFKTENEIINQDDIVASPLALEHLPATPQSDETVLLKKLHQLENVNRIPNDHSLTFCHPGMTVIYGGNGSGKSGYARVIKHACRARDQSETVYPDANDPLAVKKIPSAKFDIDVGGNTEEISWDRDSTSPDLLSSIAVFDSRCARSYLTSEQDVAYLPYGLDIVENLANQVLPKLTETLNSEISKIGINTDPFTHLHGDTVIGKEIENLSADSDSKVITILGTLNDTETKRLEILKKTLKEADPVAKSRELLLSVTRLKDFSKKIEKPLAWVSLEAVKKLQNLSAAKTSAEAAEAKAADALRAGEELLPGTGEQIWKTLFESARRYSIEVAYPGEEFPTSTEGSVCPLCQTELQDSDAERLKRFEEYIRNDVAKTATDARATLGKAEKKINRAELQIGADQAILDELDNLKSGFSIQVNAYQVSLSKRRDAMLECLGNPEKWSEIPALVESPRLSVRNLVAQQLKELRALANAADGAKRQALVNEFNELVARQELERSLSSVLELLQRMKDKAALEKCRSSLRTRPISDKSKEFASIAVTEELKKALDREFYLLGINHIKTKLKERSIRGKMHHQLLLDLPNVNKLEDILSEGEQRAIALGSFLAELTLANHSSGIVFDDPVSSLDHWKRRNVACRLVEEAKIRQVVVFTHDTSFLGQLRDEIDAERVPSSMMFLEWQGSTPGCVHEGLPWDHQGYKARIDTLEKAQRKLARTWPPYPGEEESTQMRNQYNGLRATLERVIQDVVFNGVVKRYRDWIKVDSLERVVGFEQAEYEAIQKLHKRSSDVVSAHDPSSEKASPVPTASDLENDIAALKRIIEMIKDRRKGEKRTT